MCEKNYSKIIAALNRLIYVIFVIAEISAVFCAALGVISLAYRLLMSRSLLFLYGAKGNVFAISVAVMIISAALSNLIDRRRSS